MKDITNNYIQVQGWMISKLNLSGNNLLAFALIYGFSQDRESEFKGSINYVCTWLGCSRPTAVKALKSLVENGLLIKRQEVRQNVTFNTYKVSLGVVKKLNPLSKETLLGGSKEVLLGGGKETLPNNTNIDNNSLNNNKDKEHPPSFELFKDYALEKAAELNLEIDLAKLQAKHMAWIEAGWRTGKGAKIKNWKSTLLNTLNFLQKEKSFAKKESESIISRLSSIS